MAHGPCLCKLNKQPNALSDVPGLTQRLLAARHEQCTCSRVNDDSGNVSACIEGRGFVLLGPWIGALLLWVLCLPLEQCSYDAHKQCTCMGLTVLSSC